MNEIIKKKLLKSYEDEDYKLIGKYKDKKTYDILEKGGYKFIVFYRNWLDGYRPNIVDKRNPYSIDNIKNFIKLNNITSKLLSDKYKTNKSYLQLRCQCGNIYNTSWTHFRNGHNWVCRDCANKQNGENFKSNIGDVKQEVINCGFIPLFDKYENANMPLKIMDKDGYLSESYIGNIRRMKQINRISPRNPYTIYNIKKYLKDNNINLELISDKYINKNEPLKWKCPCGNIFEMNFETFRNGKIRCNSCTKKDSELELLVSKWLDDNNIKYEREYRISDCKDKRCLPFDFKIDINNELRLIEVDGIFHYEVQYNKEDRLKEQQKHDQIKNDYCKEHNIKLLRIPYWEFTNNNYKNILNNFIKE